MGYLIFGLFVFGIVPVINGECWGTSMRHEVTDYGQIIEYCEYDYINRQRPVKLKLMPGSQMKTTDCVTCMCTSGGLLCCTNDGKGRYLRQHLPYECEVIIDGCEVYYVMRSDITRDCYTGEVISLQKFLHAGRTIL